MTDAHPDLSDIVPADVSSSPGSVTFSEPPTEEWEYGYAGGDWEPATLRAGTHPDVPRTHRRRPAGPWEPVS